MDSMVDQYLARGSQRPPALPASMSHSSHLTTGRRNRSPYLPSIWDVVALLEEQYKALPPIHVNQEHGPDQSARLGPMDSQYASGINVANSSTTQLIDARVRPVLKKGPWTPQEDRRLQAVIQTLQSPNPSQINWVKVSRLVGSRTAKQCRERYYQNLKPGLNHGPITTEEGVEIERLVNEIGHHWAEIARRIENRSDNAVKNWWNGRQNCLRRRERREEAQASSLQGLRARRSSIESPRFRLTEQPQQVPLQTPLPHWANPILPSPTLSESVYESPGGNYHVSPRQHSCYVPFVSNTSRQLRSERPISHDNHVLGHFPHISGSLQASIYQLPTAPNSPAASFMVESTANYDQQSRHLFDAAYPRAQKMTIDYLLN